MTDDVTYMDLDDYAKPPAELTGDEPKESYEDYVSKAVTLRELKDNSQWTLGDLLHKMAEDLGDNKDAVGRTPLDMLAADINMPAGTLRQYRWVSGKFKIRSDRQTGLEWSHYRHCAGCENPMEWINKAVENNWTGPQLKNEIQIKEDKLTVESGRIGCTHCNDPLPDENSLHLRQGKLKFSYCCESCVIHHLLGVIKLREEAAAAKDQTASSSVEAS